MVMDSQPRLSSTPDLCLCFPAPVRVMSHDSLFSDLLRSPEILRMSELNDSSELQTYSSAVLYVLSAVTPPVEHIELIADYFVDAVRSSSVSHICDWP